MGTRRPKVSHKRGPDFSLRGFTDSRTQKVFGYSGAGSYWNPFYTLEGFIQGTAMFARTGKRLR